MIDPLINVKLRAIQSLLTGDDIYKVGVFNDLTIDTSRSGGIENFPSDDEINTAYETKKAEYDAQEYARNRQIDYPDWSTQLEKIYDDGLTKWKSEMVDPVKAKWPKDNSGPV